MITTHPEKDVDDAPLFRSPVLKRLTLSGWKSIKSIGGLEFSAVNVLIGQNGAGKSNLISFFRMLGSIADRRLQDYVLMSGGANSLLHCGAAATPQLSFSLAIESDTDTVTNSLIEYDARLIHAAPDTLILAEENDSHSAIAADRRFHRNPQDTDNIAGAHTESDLPYFGQPGTSLGEVVEFMSEISIYQFHNTSQTARTRQRWNTSDCYILKEDAANIAPYLMNLYETDARRYRLIVDTIRQIAPFFQDFEFGRTGDSVMLQWRERNSDLVYSAFQASDGMLRMIALVALLLQPPYRLPAMLIIDEPELGLHPYAINVIAGLIRAVSIHTQVLVATQSTNLLDGFEPEDVIVVDRHTDGQSHFRRLDVDSLHEWLDHYSLSELWEKNVIGGGP